MPQFMSHFSSRKQTSSTQRVPTSHQDSVSYLSAVKEQDTPIEGGNELESQMPNEQPVERFNATQNKISFVEPTPTEDQDELRKPSKATRRYAHGRASRVGRNVPNGDWNVHKSQPGKSVAPKNSTIRTRYGTLFRGLKTRSGVAFAQQNPGVLVWHWDFRPILHRNGPKDNKTTTTAPDGTLWLKKGRYWIIVARSKHRVTEIPIYTYGDEGLERKPKELKVEYMSVKAIKLGGTKKEFVNQSPNNPVLEIARLQNPEEDLRATMVAHFTETITRDVDDDELRYVGNLSHSSMKTIQEAVRRHIGQAPDDH